MKPRPLSYKTLLNFPFISILTMGCFYQIYTICEMFFNYPTNVLIDTKFDAIERPLPAISFCTKYRTRDRILRSNSRDIYAQIQRDQFKQMVTANINSNSFRLIENVSSYIWQNSVDTISLTHYCLTINSLMKGKFD